ncbi:MAG: hypothetical protein CG440_456, partial [Methanosaeta sp. NSM2]
MVEKLSLAPQSKNEAYDAQCDLSRNRRIASHPGEKS